jgi:hypothetical protein
MTGGADDVRTHRIEHGAEGALGQRHVGCRWPAFSSAALAPDPAALADPAIRLKELLR